MPESACLGTKTGKAIGNNLTVETRKTSAFKFLLGKDKEEHLQITNQSDDDKPANKRKKPGKAVKNKKKIRRRISRRVQMSKEKTSNCL